MASVEKNSGPSTASPSTSHGRRWRQVRATAAARLSAVPVPKFHGATTWDSDDSIVVIRVVQTHSVTAAVVHRRRRSTTPGVFTRWTVRKGSDTWPSVERPGAAGRPTERRSRVLLWSEARKAPRRFDFSH